MKKVAHLGIYCKHILAMEQAYRTGELLPLAQVYDTPEWRAKHPLPRPCYAYESATAEEGGAAR